MSRCECQNSLALIWFTLGALGSAAVAVAGPADDLFNAAERGDAATVQAFLDRGVAVDSKIKFGATALMAASQNGHGKVVQLLLAKGAEVNAKGPGGVTALIIGSEHGHG